MLLHVLKDVRLCVCVGGEYVWYIHEHMYAEVTEGCWMSSCMVLCLIPWDRVSH